MKCVVIDTNVLVSALGWDGNERRLMRLAMTGGLEMAVSPALIEEFDRTASQPRLGFSEDDVDEFIGALIGVARVVKPGVVLEAARDRADNRVLECALEAKAEFIATGDRDLLSLKEFGGTRIVTAKELLNLLGH
jgi:putative PIN family toxin of toxin-antitoxin system